MSFTAGPAIESRYSSAGKTRPATPSQAESAVLSYFLPLPPMHRHPRPRPWPNVRPCQSRTTARALLAWLLPSLATIAHSATVAPVPFPAFCVPSFARLPLIASVAYFPLHTGWANVTFVVLEEYGAMTNAVAATYG
nr:hypothetical protein CFP56_20209 [Quercus suber]